MELSDQLNLEWECILAHFKSVAPIKLDWTEVQDHRKLIDRHLRYLYLHRDECFLPENTTIVTTRKSIINVSSNLVFKIYREYEPEYLSDKVYLSHELMVGLIGINTLKDSGYSYMYLPLYLKWKINEDKSQATALLPNEPAYDQIHQSLTLIYERIHGHILTYYLNKMTVSTFLLYFLSILQSLKVGAKLEFMHCDLHQGNIILKPWDKIRALDLAGVKGSIYLELLPVMIDYGASRIKHQGLSFSADYDQSFNEHIDMTRYNPMIDVYKLLVSAEYVALKEGNVSLSHAITPLRHIIDRRGIDMVSYGYLPKGSTKVMTIDQYCEKLWLVCPEVLTLIDQTFGQGAK